MGNVSVNSGERVGILVDPICPWTLRTSMWLVEVRRSIPIEIEWGLLSLEYVNRGNPSAERFKKNRLAMRVLFIVSERNGMSSLEQMYLTLAKMVHHRGMALEGEDTILEALSASGLESSLLEDAKRKIHLDRELWSLYASHCESGAFGVPTIYFGNSKRPFYGPVIDLVPQGSEAVELWQYVKGLASLEFFYELKRER